MVSNGSPGAGELLVRLAGVSSSSVVYTHSQARLAHHCFHANLLHRNGLTVFSKMFQVSYREQCKFVSVYYAFIVVLVLCGFSLILKGL